jgi:hypothetical protein
MTMCRCGHDLAEHHSIERHPLACWCGCPLFRPVETPESLTLRGVETTE